MNLGLLIKMEKIMRRRILLALLSFLIIINITGCSDGENKDTNSSKEDSEQQTNINLPKKELTKYSIDDIDYFNLENSVYISNTNTTSLTFYDLGLLKNGKSSSTCYINLRLNGVEYLMRDEPQPCSYWHDRIDDNKMEVTYNYKRNYKDTYIYGQMTINIISEDNGKTLTFNLEDGVIIKVNNSHYQKFIDLGINEVLFNKSNGRLYTIDGSPIESNCGNIDLCNNSNYSKINLDNYIIKNYEKMENQKEYPEIKYLDNATFYGGSYSISFYKDYTCKPITDPPSFYAQNKFTNCNYKIKKKDDNTYLITVSLSYYFDDYYGINEATFDFDGYVKKGEVVMIKANSYDAVTVFQDYKNYSGVVEMFLPTN